MSSFLVTEILSPFYSASLCPLFPSIEPVGAPIAPDPWSIVLPINLVILFPFSHVSKKRLRSAPLFSKCKGRGNTLCVKCRGSHLMWNDVVRGHFYNFRLITRVAHAPQKRLLKLWPHFLSCIRAGLNTGAFPLFHLSFGPLPL